MINWLLEFSETIRIPDPLLCLPAQTCKGLTDSVFLKIATGIDGIKSLAVALAVKESATTGQAVHVNYEGITL